MPNPLPAADDKIRHFFTPPNRPIHQHLSDDPVGFVSVLYLLRRELIDTAGHDPDLLSETEFLGLGAQRRLFATMILCFTTIDLLAKFVSVKSGVGDRFEEFLSSPYYGQLEPETATLLWDARNSLVHQFNVPSASSKSGFAKVGIEQGYKHPFADGSHGHSIVRAHGDTAVIYVDGVIRLTLSSIEHLHDALYGSDSLAARERFVAVYEDLGLIAFGSPSLLP